MKDKYKEPRTVTILRHVNNFLLESSVSIETYADDVRQIYHQSVPNAKARVLHFHEDKDPAENFRANGQLIGRILNRTTRMPADLEEAMVMALPVEIRRKCLSDLASRYDMLPVPEPVPGTHDDAANLARLLKETGDTMEALGPIFADGKVTPEDAKHAKHALTQLNELMTEVVSMSARITSILPGEAGLKVVE